jgi:hypothetical protein
VRYPDGAVINGTGAEEIGYTTVAAIGPGDIMALFGTGFGPTSATIPTGTVFTGAYTTNNPVTVTIGNVPAEVLWAGLVGPGLYQMNVRTPTTLSDGDHAVIAAIAGSSTQSGARVKIAASARLTQAPVAPERFSPLDNLGLHIEQILLFAGVSVEQRGVCTITSRGAELSASDGYIIQLA